MEVMRDRIDPREHRAIGQSASGVLQSKSVRRLLGPGLQLRIERLGSPKSSRVKRARLLHIKQRQNFAHGIANEWFKAISAIDLDAS
jgi:hypothetical protein